MNCDNCDAIGDSACPIRIERFYDDASIIQHIEATEGLRWRGQLTPTNLTAVDHASQNYHLYKCAECPTFLRNMEPRTHPCITSRNCCDQYYLVFQTLPNRAVEPRLTSCCTGEPSHCADLSLWYAVDPFLTPQEFDGAKHLLPLQIEQNYALADALVHRCQECQCNRFRYAGAAQWRSCATCCGSANDSVDTDLVRDSLVRIGHGVSSGSSSKYWQYKPRSRTEADRVHGIYGQSVFRGHGPCHYRPDHKRRWTPVRGGYVPANNAPRAVSAVMAPRLCDGTACRTILF